MRSKVTKLVVCICGTALLMGASSIPAPATTTHKSKSAVTTSSKKSSKSTHGKKSRKNSKKTAKIRGQQAIDNARARQIQEALIREHYLNGEPTGSMDQATRDALVRFQGDNGWQTKVVPDSRALIKLGLGPDHSKALNPEALNRPDAARDQVPGGAPNLR